jgi:HipA-like protein
MLEKLHDSFDSLAGLQRPEEKSAAFNLTLKGLKIGTLSYQSGHWTFRYSDAFQRQDSVKPIINFPVKDKEYRSERLWPFFLLRIPSLRQPSVKRLIEERGPGELNDATLLRMFGRRSVANPFELIPA